MTTIGKDSLGRIRKPTQTAALKRVHASRAPKGGRVSHAVYVHLLPGELERVLALTPEERGAALLRGLK